MAESVWMAPICQFGLRKSSLVPPAYFRSMRKVSRHRRQLVRDRARARDRILKVLGAAGVHIGGILSDVFGANGKRLLDSSAHRLHCSIRPETGTPSTLTFDPTRHHVALPPGSPSGSPSVTIYWGECSSGTVKLAARLYLSENWPVRCGNEGSRRMDDRRLPYTEGETAQRGGTTE